MLQHQDPTLGSRKRPAGTAYYPEPASPSGRFNGETYTDMRKRQRADPFSPGGIYAPENMVTREHHPLNVGRRSKHCIGRPGKKYSRYDITGPIIDSMVMMYAKQGSGTSYEEDARSEVSYAIEQPKPVLASIHNRLHEYGYGTAPASQPEPLCKGCRTTNRNDFTLTLDKDCLVCKCGVVASPIRISQEREKNCPKDEDKTQHADRPYEPSTDRFDRPALSCDELRRQREQEATGTRISKKAKEKHGLGWQHEHNARKAAQAERQRQDMEPRDQTKGQLIVIEIEKLFTPLEPIDAKVKRYCRMQADLAWREAVRHGKVCCAKARCQLRIRDKGPSVIADAALYCALQQLLKGEGLERVPHSHILGLNEKLVAMQTSRGSSCAHRAVRTIVATLLDNADSETPVQPCAMPSVAPSPSPSQLSEKSSSSHAQGVMSPSSSGGHVLLTRNDSSLEDMGQSSGSEVIQLRDSVNRVHRALGTAMSLVVRDAAIRALQNAEFRSSLAIAREASGDVSKLTPHGIGYVLLEATAQAIDDEQGESWSPKKRSVQPRMLQTFCTGGIGCIEPSIGALKVLLPSEALVAPSQEEDGLF